MATSSRPPSWGLYLVITRTIAAVLTLLSVFAFVLILLNKGFDLQNALLGAGAGGVIAAQITHRLLGTLPPPDDSPPEIGSQPPQN